MDNIIIRIIEKLKRIRFRLIAVLTASAIALSGCGLEEFIDDFEKAVASGEFSKSTANKSIDESQDEGSKENETGGFNTSGSSSSYKPSGDSEVAGNIDDNNPESKNFANGNSSSSESDNSGYGNSSDVPTNDYEPTLEELRVYSEDELAAIGAAQSGLYAYEMLNSSEKNIYKQIYGALMDMSVGVRLDTNDADLVNKIFSCVMMDHPEIFWINGYVYLKYNTASHDLVLGFRGTYTCDRNAREQKQEYIDAYVSRCLGEMPSGDDYTRIKYIYEYIIGNTEYDENAVENQNICSVFIYGRSVCQGYAKAFQYLCYKAGIKCTLVTGDVKSGEAHAWNLVYSDGSYYYVDATWGDPSYRDGDMGEVKIPDILYDFLCAPSYEMSLTHTPDTVVALPSCISITDNYYVREGAYFTDINDYQLRALFSAAYAKNQEYVVVKCSDYVTYEGMKIYLLDRQKIFDYLGSYERSINYWTNDEAHYIGFWLST